MPLQFDIFYTNTKSKTELQQAGLVSLSPAGLTQILFFVFFNTFSLYFFVSNFVLFIKSFCQTDLIRNSIIPVVYRLVLILHLCVRKPRDNTLRHLFLNFGQEHILTILSIMQKAIYL